MITPTQEKIMIQLRKYQYLTVSQMMQLGISGNRSFLNKQLKYLRMNYKTPLIYSQNFGVHPQKWKLESVHALSKHGAKLLEEEWRFEGELSGSIEENINWKENQNPSWNRNEKLKFCANPKQLFVSQYFHRKYTIDVQIAIIQYCKKQNINLRLYHNYFEKTTTQTKNEIRSICSFPYNEAGHRMESDALFGINIDGKKKLFAVEFYNDEKVIRVMRALEKYRQALSIGNPSILFGMESNTHVLLIFREESMVWRVKKRLESDLRFEGFLPYFHLLSLEEIQNEGISFIIKGSTFQ